MIIYNHGVVITWMLWTWSVSVLLTSWIFSLLPTPLQWWSNTMGCEILLLSHLKEAKMLIRFEVAWLNMLLGCFFVIFNSFLQSFLWTLLIYRTIRSIQLLSHVQLLATPWTAALQASQPSATPGNCSNSYHRVSDAIQPSYPLSSPSPPAFDLSGSFPVSQFFTWGGQSIGASASSSVLPMNILDWFPLGWTGWISLQNKGLSRVFSNTTVQKHQFFSARLSL